MKTGREVGIKENGSHNIMLNWKWKIVPHIYLKHLLYKKDGMINLADGNLI